MRSSREAGESAASSGPEATEANLEGLPVDLFEGDLLDRPSLDGAVRGIEVLYHVAADYRLWAKDPEELYRSNAGGTENVLAAAAEAGVSRVVYTSSVGALGLTKDGSPADERTPVRREEVVGHYKKSKFDAERVAEKWAASGLPVVIVNPSTPVGELDVKPTPTGQVIVDFLNRRIPAYVDTGLNVIDVRDVAVGHLLAAEKGRPGEKYILGHRNMTLQEILETLARLTGLPAPRAAAPARDPPRRGGCRCARLRPHREAAARQPRERPDVAAPDVLRRRRKAVRELGLPQSPVEEALARAVAWFREKGHVRA